LIEFDAEVSDKQHEFLYSPHKFTSFIGGVGSGKTFAGAFKALMMPAGSMGMVLAPTYPMMKDATLKTFIDMTIGAVKDFNKSDYHLTLKNGSEIIFRSADNPDRLRGPNLGWFWIDEGAMMTEEVWDIMLGRLRLDPGLAWITTTPKGYNWVYRIFGPDRMKEYHSVRASTRDNVWLPGGYVQSLQDKYSTAFAKQEIEGEFCEIGGTRVKREWIRYGEPPENLFITMGVDLAISVKAEADFSACVVVGEERTGDTRRYWVLDALRVQAPFHQVLQFIQATAAKWKPSKVVIEQVQYQAAVVQELLRTTALPVSGVRPDKDKLMRFQPLEARYEQGLVWHSTSLPREFEDELLGFPVGEHDDMVDALAYAYQSLGEQLPSAMWVDL